jgi:hypothetical protein
MQSMVWMKPELGIIRPVHTFFFYHGSGWQDPPPLSARKITTAALNPFWQKEGKIFALEQCCVFWSPPGSSTHTSSKVERSCNWNYQRQRHGADRTIKDSLNNLVAQPTALRLSSVLATTNNNKRRKQFNFLLITICVGTSFFKYRRPITSVFRSCDKEKNNRCWWKRCHALQKIVLHLPVWLVSI